MRLAALLRKELTIVLRSRTLLLVLILYPLVIVGILGYAFSQPNQKVPLAIVNEDINPQTGQPNEHFVESPVAGSTSRLRVSSQQVIQDLRPLADITQTTPAEARRLLLTGQVQAVVRFPPNFARDIANLDSNGEINITIDQSDPARAKFMEIAIRGVVQAFQERIVEEKVRLVVQAINGALPVVLDPNDSLYPGFRGVRDRLVRILNEQDNLTEEQKTMLREGIAFLETIINTLENSRDIVDSIAQPVQVVIGQERSGTLFIRDLVVPAAIALGIFWTGAVATSSLVVYERESAAYTRLRITPASAWSIYGSKILLTLAIVLLQALLILGASIAAWDTRVDNPGLTLAVIALASFAAIGLGLFLAGISRDVNGTVLLSVLITFPMMLLGGLFFPVTFMPEGAQALARMLPLTHAVAGLRGAMLRGFGFADAADVLLILFLFGAALTLLGVALGKRQERKR